MTMNTGRSPSGRATHERSRSSVSPPPVGVPNAMVERIARGLFLAEHPGAEWHGGRARSIWFSRAWAALEAIREPTDAMLQPGCKKHIPNRPMHDTTPPWPDERYRTEKECSRFVARRRIWKSMIDAAIAWPTSDDVASAMSAGTAATTEIGAGLQPASATAESRDARGPSQ